MKDSKTPVKQPPSLGGATPPPPQDLAYLSQVRNQEAHSGPVKQLIQSCCKNHCTKNKVFH